MRTTNVRRVAVLGALVLGAGCELVAGVRSDVGPYPAGSGGGGTAPTCASGKKDGDETGKDCGGSCPACVVGEGCKTGADCESKSCSAGGTCLAPACDDQTKNGDETDADCGGGTCPACGPDMACKVDADCLSGACGMSGVCKSTCDDMSKGGDETDVDCGGGAISGCPVCADGKVCKVNADCASGVCNVDACASDYVWAEGFGAVTTAVAVDYSGAVSVTGFVPGGTTVDFGGGPVNGDNPYNGDIFVAGFDASGKYQWSQVFTGNDWQSAMSISVNPNGDLAVAGYFGVGPFQLGNLYGAASENLFVVTFTPSGSLRWVKGFGGPGDANGLAVAIDDTGSVLVGGTLQGSLSFGGPTLKSASPNDRDILLVKLDAFGNHVWSKHFGDATTIGGRSAAGVAVDSGRNAVVTGGFTGAVDFGGGPLVSAGGSDVFVAKFDPSGAYLWSKSFGDFDEQAGVAVATDTAGNVIVVGDYADLIDFGSGAIPSAGGSDVFVVKFDPAGTYLWSRHWGGAEDDHAASVAVDPLGNVLVTGSFQGTMNCGGGPLVSAGGKDAFVVKLDASGGFMWGKRFGDVKDQGGAGIAAYHPKSLLVVGDLGAGAADFGGGPVAGNMFLAKLRTP